MRRSNSAPVPAAPVAQGRRQVRRARWVRFLRRVREGRRLLSTPKGRELRLSPAGRAARQPRGFPTGRSAPDRLALLQAPPVRLRPSGLLAQRHRFDRLARWLPLAQSRPAYRADLSCRAHLSSRAGLGSRRAPQGRDSRGCRVAQPSRRPPRGRSVRPGPPARGRRSVRPDRASRRGHACGPEAHSMLSAMVGTRCRWPRGRLLNPPAGRCFARNAGVSSLRGQPRPPR